MHKIKTKAFLAVLASTVLLVSVFSAGVVFSAEETEDDTYILVYKRGPGFNTDYFRNEDGYELIEEYDSYILVETSEENIGLLKTQGYVVERLDNRDHVGLQSYSFRTREGEPDIPEELKIESYPEDGSGYYIVQFIGPIREEWKERLEDEGVVLHEFRQRFNFIVEMDAETKRDVEEFDFVNWVGIYQPAYRFDQDLLEERGELYLDLSFFDDVDAKLTVRKLFSLGCEIDSVVGNRVSLYSDAEFITELANIHGVKAITEGVDEYQLFNADATWVTQTNEEDNRKVTELGVTGKGQLITVMDSELDVEHEAFADPDGDPIGDNHRKIQKHYVPADAGGDLEAGVYHGTHVAGTVLGQSPPYDEYSNHDGNAMGARLIFQDVSEDDLGSVLPPSDMYEDAYGDVYEMGSRIHTNSWGGRGGYGEDAITSDEFIWDHKDFNIVYAAGNEGPEAGSISGQGEAKNILTVGAVQNVGVEPIEPRGGSLSPSQEEEAQENVAGFSSRGYAEDGRIKPTIMHVGEGLMSAGERGDMDLPEPLEFNDELSNSPSDEEEYSEMSGTSMSAPGIAGQAGQVRQYYEEGWYPLGTPHEELGFNPSSALVKATLINSAVEVSGEGAYENDLRFPNNDQGFGRTKLDRALNFEGDARNSIVFDSWLGSWDRGIELETGESWDMEFEVDDPSQELEVTLAWNDHPGPEGADGNNPAMVNDLDLELIGPDGTRYAGNAFTGHNPGYSEPEPTNNPWSGLRDGGFDGLNVEQNILLLPDQNDLEEGTYKVSVNAHNVPEGRQDFAVVISGGVEDEEIGEPPEVDLLFPAGEEEFDAYDERDIMWDISEVDVPLDVVTLDYSADGGNSWNDIGSVETGEGVYGWTVPNEDSDECYVRVTVRDENYMIARDFSEAFTIVGVPPPPPENIAVEHDGEEDQHNLITWDASPYDSEFLSHYNIYRAEDQDGPWDPIAEVEDDGSASYSYVDEDSGVGDGVLWWYIVRAVGHNGLEEENENAVMQPDELELTIEILGEGEVTVDPDEENYQHGDEVELTAVPDEHWYFVEWTGDHESDEDEITIVMDSHKSVTAHFEEITYELDIVVEGEGYVDVTPDLDEYTEGTEVSLTAEPAESWSFIEWTGDIDKIDDPYAEETTIEMWNDYNITAHFEEMRELSVSVEGEGNIIVDGEEFEEYTEEILKDTEITLEAVPDEGYEFVGWTGDHESEEEEITIMLDEDKEITANFEIIEYVLTINVEGEGTTYPGSGDHTYEYGDEIEIEAFSEHGWVFGGWTGDHESEEKEITLDMYDDKEITATFLRGPQFDVNIISPDADEEFGTDEKITFGYEITNTGDVEETHEIEFKVDGELEDSVEITLGAGEVHEGEFTWETEEEGDYEIVISVDGDDIDERMMDLTISIEDPFPLLLILGIIVILLVIIVIAGMFMMKNKGKSDKDAEDEYTPIEEEKSEVMEEEE